MVSFLDVRASQSQEMDQLKSTETLNQFLGKKLKTTHFYIIFDSIEYKSYGGFDYAIQKLKEITPSRKGLPGVLVCFPLWIFPLFYTLLAFIWMALFQPIYYFAFYLGDKRIPKSQIKKGNLEVEVQVKLKVINLTRVKTFQVSQESWLNICTIRTRHPDLIDRSYRLRRVGKKSDRAAIVEFLSTIEKIDDAQRKACIDYLFPTFTFYKGRPSFLTPTESNKIV
jgi:hypothetical protein